MGESRVYYEKVNTKNSKFKPAKDFETFCKDLTEFLSVNKVDFSCYIGDIRVLPKDVQKHFSIFSECDENSPEENTDENLGRIAMMFYELCKNKKLNIAEQLEKFAGVTAWAAIKSGDKSFKDYETLIKVEDGDGD